MIGRLAHPEHTLTMINATLIASSGSPTASVLFLLLCAVVGMVRPPGIPDLFWRAACWVIAPPIVIVLLLHGALRWIAVPVVVAALIGTWAERRKPLPDAKALVDNLRQPRPRGVGAGNHSASRADAENTAKSRPLDLVVEVGQRPYWFPLGDTPEVGQFFWIHDVTIANNSDRRVNLSPTLVVELAYDGPAYAELDQRGIVVVPDSFTRRDALLQRPISIDGGDVVSGDIGFSLVGSHVELIFGSQDNFQPMMRTALTGQPIMYLLLRDIGSGQVVACDVTRGGWQGIPTTLKALRSRYPHPGR